MSDHDLIMALNRIARALEERNGLTERSLLINEEMLCRVPKLVVSSDSYHIVPVVEQPGNKAKWQVLKNGHDLGPTWDSYDEATAWMQFHRQGKALPV